MTGVSTYRYGVESNNAKKIPPELEATLQGIKWIERDIKNYDTYLARLVETLQTRVPDYSWVGLYLVQSGEIDLTISKGLPECERKRVGMRRGVVGRAAASGEVVTGKDILSFQSEAAVPLEWHGVIFGVLSIRSTKKNLFSNEHIEFLQEVAREAGKRYVGDPY
jgi:putative methionine-R-sulfoxide reductase with GAF domain